MHNLQQAAKSGSQRAQKQLDDAPVLSSDLIPIWHAFIDLNNAGSGSISYQDIKAYCDLQVELSPFEVEAIQAMSRLRGHNG